MLCGVRIQRLLEEVPVDCLESREGCPGVSATLLLFTSQMKINTTEMLSQSLILTVEKFLKDFVVLSESQEGALNVYRWQGQRKITEFFADLRGQSAESHAPSLSV